MSENPNQFYKNMDDDEIYRYFREYPDDEAAFIEYSSRLDWKTPPEFYSDEQEIRFLENLVAKKSME